jgi:outer membrane protein
MKNTYLSIIAVLVALIGAIYTFLNRNPKIGYVETAVLMNEFKESIKARDEFEADKSRWDQNIKTINDSLTAALERMKSGFDKASEKEKDAMRQELDSRNAELSRYTKAIQQKAVEREKELMDPVIRKINTFLESWGKEHGFSLILGTMSGGNILQASPKLNLTSEIVKDLNAAYQSAPQTSPLPKPAPDSVKK